MISSLAPHASACGASGGGAAGLAACSLEEHEEETRPKWHVGETVSATITGISFNDGSRFEQQRVVAVTSLESLEVPRLSFQIGAGPVFPGTMRQGSEHYATSAGVVMAIGAGYRFLDAKGARPFVLGTVGLTMLAMNTESSLPTNAHALYDAFDMRLGVLAGWPLFENGALTLYGAARAFGGPVYWTRNHADVTGTDVNHYQLGTGISVRLGRHADFVFEAVPLGEQGLSGGLGVSF